MASSGNDAVRRKWDRQLFAKKVQERQRAAREAALERQRATDARAADPTDPHAPKRAWLAPRTHTVDLEAKVGHTEVVAQARDERSGFWCSVCERLLKDSSAYLSHVNSVQHQRQLGMSMRTKRASLDEVRRTFEELRAIKRAGGDIRQILAKRQRLEEPVDQVHKKPVPPAPEPPLDATQNPQEGDQLHDPEAEAVARAMGLPEGFASSKKS